MEHNFDLYSRKRSLGHQSAKIRRKGMRRCLAVLLAAVMASGTCLPAIAAEEPEIQAEEMAGTAATENEQAAETEPEENQQENAESEENAEAVGTENDMDADQQDADPAEPAADAADNADDITNAAGDESDTVGDDAEITGDESETQEIIGDESPEAGDSGNQDQMQTTESASTDEGENPDNTGETSDWLKDYDYTVQIEEDGTESLYIGSYHGNESTVYVHGSAQVNGVIYTKVTYGTGIWNGGGTVENIIFEEDYVFPEDSGWYFNGAYNLVSIDMSRADTSKITNMSYMFYDCQNLRSVNFGSIDASSINDASHLFSGCSSLEEIDVSFLAGSNNLQSVDSMFEYCSSLRSIDMGGVNLSGVSCWSLLDGCDNLEEIVTPESVPYPEEVEIALPCAMADQDVNIYSLLPGGSLSLQKVEIPDELKDYECQFSYTSVLLTEYKGTDTEITVPGTVTVFGKQYRVGSMGCIWGEGITSLSFGEGYWFSSGYYSGMFSSMTDLELVDLRNVEFSDDTEISGPFDGCGRLKTIYLPAGYSFESKLPKMFKDEAGNTYTEIPTGLPYSIKLQAVTASEWLDDYSYHITEDNEGIILGRYTGHETEIVVPGRATVDGKEYGKILIDYNCWDNCVSLKFEKGVQISSSASNMFSSALSFESVDFSELDGNPITDAESMFNFCANMKSLDLSGLDFSNCTNADRMLANCSKLETIVTPKNVNCTIALPEAFADSEGNVYSEIPQGLDYSITLTKAEISEWLSAYNYKTSGDSVILISYKNKEFFDPETDRFNYIQKLTLPGTATIGTKQYNRVVLSPYLWSGLTIEEFYFENGVALPEDCANIFPFNGVKKIDLSEVDTTEVTDMRYIFKNCSGLTSIAVPKNLSLDAYLPGAFTDENGTMYTSLPKNVDESFTITKADNDERLNDYRFYVTEDSIVLTGYIGDDSDVIVPGNGTVGNKLYNTVEIADGFIWGGWESKNIAFESGVVFPDNCKRIFNSPYIESIDLTNVDTSNVTNMSEMFSGCYSVTSINVSGMDTSNVTDMSYMFSDCSSLTELDLSGFNTSKVKNMRSMFQYCSSLQKLNLSGLDTSSVTNMSEMFSCCSGLSELDVAGFNTLNVEDASFMFSSCDSLLELDLSSWDFSSLNNGEYMFGGSIPVIKAPVHVPVEAHLRGLYTGSDGFTYLTLPMNKDKSILLTWTSESGDPTGNVSGDPVQQIRIITQPQDVKAAEGEEVSCTVEAEGEGLTYQWYYKNAKSSKFLASSQITDTYKVTLNEKTKNRKVYCVITDANGNSVTTDTVGLYVYVPFAITEQPTDTYVDALGEKASVTVAATGVGLTYQWYYKNAGASKFLESTNTGETYTITVKEKVKNRQVYCVITDINGETLTSDTVGIYVNEAFEITQQPEDVYVNALGEKATVSVTATGSGLTYQWYYKNAGASKFLASTSKTPTYNVTVNERSRNRKLYCVITDAHGETLTSDTVGIYVNEPFEILEQPESVTVGALGEKATVSVKATGVGLTYQWYYKNAGASKFLASTNKTATYSVTVNERSRNRQVYCVVTDVNGESLTTDTVMITVGE